MSFLRLCSAARISSSSSRAAFTTSSICRSNIGKKAIAYPSTVTFTQNPQPNGDIDLQVSGPKGTANVLVESFFNLKWENTAQSTGANGAAPAPISSLALTVQDPSKKVQRSRWGLRRTLIANAVQGLTEGFVLPLRLVGVGYRAQLEDDPTRLAEKGKRLNMKLGFAHPVFISVPGDIQAETPMPTRIVLRGKDKQRLGQFAAQIRSWRKPEPYKGKGIFVGDETIKLKSVKKK
ncbi:hypothetical protein FS837_011607 [Tulasnella sp. UAMH 9824]|nr:hypothetical protein FS837_011607 [Tulasnella sp. UAMH 9824]